MGTDYQPRWPIHILVTTHGAAKAYETGAWREEFLRLWRAERLLAVIRMYGDGSVVPVWPDAAVDPDPTPPHGLERPNRCRCAGIREIRGPGAPEATIAICELCGGIVEERTTP